MLELIEVGHWIKDAAFISREMEDSRAQVAQVRRRSHKWIKYSNKVKIHK